MVQVKEAEPDWQARGFPWLVLLPRPGRRGGHRRVPLRDEEARQLVILLIDKFREK